MPQKAERCQPHHLLTKSGMADQDEGKLGLWMTLCLAIGGMIGAGIFMLPVALAPFGSNAIVGWLVSSVGALLIAFALARMAGSGKDGGIQSYIEESFGPTIAYLVTWSFWCSVWAANAAVAIAAASAVSSVMPLLANPLVVAMIALGFVTLLTLVNALGARSAGGMAILTVAIKVLPLIAVVVILVMHWSTGQHLQPLAPAPLSVGNIGSTVALTFFAITGFETVLAPVNKVRNPSRTLPIAVMAGTAFVAFIYFFSSTAVLLLLPAPVVASSAAPFADVVGASWGKGAADLAALGMAVSAFGCLNGGILIAGEMAYSMALRGDLPRLFSRTRGLGTPVAGQALSSAIVAVLVGLNTSRTTAGLFTFMILLSTSSVLFLYFFGLLAGMKGRPSVAARGAFILGFIFLGYAFYGSGLEADAWSVVLLGIGVIVRSLMHWLNARSVKAIAR